MKPAPFLPASFLRFVLVVPLLLSLPCVGRAQLVATATYTTNGGAGPFNGSQKVIAVGTDGYTRFLVMESNSSGYGSQLTYVRCLDQDCATYNTHSWHDNDTETLSLSEFSLAIGPDGYARIAYQISDSIWNSDGEVTNYGILGFIQCFDDDCGSFSNNDSVDYTAGGNIASVAVGSDGTAYIVYDNGNIYPGPQGIGLATCNSDGCSTSTIATGISPRDFTAAAIAIGSDGNPVIAYSDVTFSNDNSYVSSSGHYYQNGTDTVVSSDAAEPDLSIGPDDLARIYFQNNTTPGASFIKCTNASCSSPAASPITLPGEDVYGWGSLAVGADGNGRLEVDLGSWPDSAYYVECTAADCSTWDSTLISANAGDSFPYGLTSLVNDQNGIPRMITESYSTGIVYQVRPTVSAVISQNTSGTVSSDDAAASTYQAATSTTNLGMITVFGMSQAGCAGGIETVGTIQPRSYMGNVVIRRTLVNQGIYVNSTEDTADEHSNVNDTSPAQLQDQDPQSGGSGGKVYDLDAPGIQALDTQTYRIRDNFLVYAALSNGTRISPDYYFYVRLSCTKTSGFPGYQFVNDVAGDNQIGTGMTNTSWNLR